MRQRVEIFAELGRRLEGFGSDQASCAAILQAVEQNGWFAHDDIVRAVAAIGGGMLRREVLQRWLGSYSFANDRQRNVAVIMAGNIPLVGFFDMMCVVLSGGRALIKPSSKDSVLIDYVVGLLREIDPLVAIETYVDQPLDAVIATGSDNTNRYFRAAFGSLPSILRANRHSVAVLSGKETDHELKRLGDDIFLYNGLGCRNVSHLLVPRDYDVEHLVAVLSQREGVNYKYIANYRQQRALRTVCGERFIDGGHFTMRHSDELPEYISEITYRHYEGDAQAWIEANEPSLQCVVSNHLSHRMCVPIGTAQSPAPEEYPDRRDVMAFLAELH